MNEFDELELEVETLRELTDEQLSGVAGGANSQLCDTTYYVPSHGGAWTMACPTLGTIQTG